MAWIKMLGSKYQDGEIITVYNGTWTDDTDILKQTGTMAASGSVSWGAGESGTASHSLGNAVIDVTDVSKLLISIYTSDDVSEGVVGGGTVDVYVDGSRVLHDYSGNTGWLDVSNKTGNITISGSLNVDFHNQNYQSYGGIASYSGGISSIQVQI